jgi:cytochrome c oxidase subunit 2
MSQERHITTRRGFIAAMGFGGLGLYVTWAAYGASPLPFFSTHASDDADAHGGHVMQMAEDTDHADPSMTGMHEGGPLSPVEFTRRHAEFLKRFQEADGSVRPVAVSAAPVHEPDSTMAGHDHTAAIVHRTSTAEPIEVYFLAGRFSFEPDRLKLRVGQPYRFQMMASDVAHGASIAFGQASRIVRLRPDLVTTLDLTFLQAGTHLVYCTVYCGPGHEGMRGLITVA